MSARIGLRHLAVVALTIALATITGPLVSPAVADDWPPVIGGGGTSIPGGDTTSGGGGTTAPTPPPEGTRWVYGGVPLTPSDYSWNDGQDGGGTGRIAGTCAPQDVRPGDGDHAATSVSWRYAVNVESGAWAGRYSWSCVYPPRPQDHPMRCVSTMDGRITREQPTTELLTTVDRASLWATNRQSVSLCKVSGLFTNIQAPMRPVGAYLLVLKGRTHDCVARTYPGTTRPDRIVECSGPVTVKQTVKGGVWCDGNLDYGFGPTSWDHEWTWTRCAGELDTLIECQTASQPVTFAGHEATGPRPVSILDDGRERTLRFAQFKPAGVVTVSNVRTTLDRLPDSSPVRAGEPVNGARQPYLLGAGGLDTQQPRDVRKYPVALYAAGVAGKPFRMQRSTLFDARVRVQTVSIATVDFTGTPLVTTNNITRTVDAEDVLCQSPVASVNVLRARLVSR